MVLPTGVSPRSARVSSQRFRPPGESRCAYKTRLFAAMCAQMDAQAWGHSSGHVGAVSVGPGSVKISAGGDGTSGQWDTHDPVDMRPPGRPQSRQTVRAGRGQAHTLFTSWAESRCAMVGGRGMLAKYPNSTFALPDPNCCPLCHRPCVPPGRTPPPRIGIVTEPTAACYLRSLEDQCALKHGLFWQFHFRLDVGTRKNRMLPLGSMARKPRG
jgi:hypothetical protein